MVIIVIFTMIISWGCGSYSAEVSNMNIGTDEDENFEIIKEAKRDVKFSNINSSADKFFVYVNNKLTEVFKTYTEAVSYASEIAGKNYIQDSSKNILWDNYLKYRVDDTKNNSEAGMRFEELSTAINHARVSGANKVVLNDDSKKVVWLGNYDSEHIIKSNVPHIEQLPELARGCEVTSLAMLLNSIGVSADKMILADQIKKDPTPYKRLDGKTYYGNPHDGFVGDIYTFDKPGLGVYNGPIFELMQKYTERGVNLTGCELDDILYFVNSGVPVWIIINSRYSKLPESEFRTWVTPSGEIKITYSEHSVLITGYDDSHIYFNDPLSSVPQSRSDRKAFTEAFNQMGRQAISCLLDD